MWSRQCSRPNKNEVLTLLCRPYLQSEDTLSGGKMSGESDENFEGVTKFSPDELKPRYFITRPKLLPKILYSNQKLNSNFYTLNYRN